MSVGRAITNHLCDVYLDLAETHPLRRITVKDVVARAEVARQTFYNYFSDIDDLACRTALRPFCRSPYGLYDGATLLETAPYLRRYRAFYSQIARRAEIKERLLRWSVETASSQFANQHLSDCERRMRQNAITLWSSGAITVILSWVAMPDGTTADVLAQVVEEAMPQFMKHERSSVCAAWA